MLEFSERSGVSCVGNGLCAGYYRDADILQLFGPCYSAPSVISLFLAGSGDYSIRCFRAKSTDIRRIVITDRVGKSGEMIDFASADKPYLFRKFELEMPVSFEFSACFDYKLNVFGFENTLWFQIPEGSTVFSACKTDHDMFCALMLPKNAAVDGNTVTFAPGRSCVAFVSGNSFAECLENMNDLPDPEIELDRRIKSWAEKFARMRDFSGILAASDHADEISALIDDTAVALISQTAQDGGVLAGQFYHLGFGRDMYGDIRGYLALGLYPEAKKSIQFFIDNMHRKGFLPNADGMGVWCSHCHENDDVEQTGYYLIELADYYEATHDAGFIAENVDYIKWLISAQERHLAGGMLPFNGDETYIAGGILPRDCINHGSMEATALYITGVCRVLEILSDLGTLDNEYIEKHLNTALSAKADFTANFIKNGSVITNSPRRVEIIGAENLPPVRHGVCLGCGRMDYLKLTSGGGYLCSDCYGKVDSRTGKTAYSLDCAAFMTGFVGCEILGDIVRQSAKIGAESKMDSPDAGNTVGYEYGLWLYLLSDKAAPTCDLERIYKNVMSLRTGSGVFCEYYRDGRENENSCPYRLWESAINLCGVLRYLEKSNK